MDYQIDNYYWVSEKDEDVWIETRGGGGKTHYVTTPLYLKKSYFGQDGNLFSSYKIDRSTGRETHTWGAGYSAIYDCELRPANKF